MTVPYTPPALDSSAFNCPSCGAFAKQHWGQIYVEQIARLSNWLGGVCNHCHQPSLWQGGIMVYPSGGTAPLPNPDLPSDIQEDYEEARAILNRSPRGAAALLRLSVQKLCKHLGEKGENINADIASLVKRGLLPAVQQALDGVRVVGNNMVHPGQIDPDDVAPTANALFRLMNLIADQMITAPAQAKAIYDLIPAGTRAAIEKRDGPRTQ